MACTTAPFPLRLKGEAGRGRFSNRAWGDMVAFCKELAEGEFLKKGGICYGPTYAFAIIAARTRSGDMGSWSSRKPVASWTALAMTAPVRMMAGSPPP